MEPDGKTELLRELNAMREKMGNTLHYWDCGRNNIDGLDEETAPESLRTGDPPEESNT